MTPSSLSGRRFPVRAYRHLDAGRFTLPVTVRAAHEILSLPIHESMSSEEALCVTSAINGYEGGE